MMHGHIRSLHIVIRPGHTYLKKIKSGQLDLEAKGQNVPSNKY